jgi:hypothetical protein
MILIKFIEFLTQTLIATGERISQQATAVLPNW